MATVRMSEELVSRLTDQYKKDYDKTSPNQEVPSHVGDTIYKHTMGVGVEKFRKLMDEVPSVKTNEIENNFFNKDSNMNVKVNAFEYSIDEDGHTVKDAVVVDEVIPMSTEKTQFGMGYSSTVTLDLYKGDESLLNNPDLAEAVNKVSEIASFNRLNYFKKLRKQHKFTDTLREFTTLNQALKAWPALSKVVQEAWPEKMVTVHKKTERRAQEKKNKEMMDGVAQELNTVILGGSLLED
tara:strand:- start:9943 stop:10659 length:717 start_codon:yes stop_codon:yes gene_type:complete